MNWKWRAFAGTLLLAGTVVWLPMAVTTNASTPLGSASSVVRGPALDNSADNGSSDNGSNDNGDSDNGSSDNGSSDNGNSNTNDNSSGNNNNNDNSSDLVPTATTVPGAPQPPNGSGPGTLTVNLEGTGNHPSLNNPFHIQITGSGAPITQIAWSADAPGPNAGPNNDDMAHAGTVTYQCNGTNPCSYGWSVVGRNVGFYTIHATATDTAGNVAQIDSQFLVSENPRN